MNLPLCQTREEALSVDRLGTFGSAIFSRRDEHQIQIRFIAELNTAQLPLGHDTETRITARFAIFFNQLIVGNSHGSFDNYLSNKA